MTALERQTSTAVSTWRGEVRRAVFDPRSALAAVVFGLASAGITAAYGGSIVTALSFGVVGWSVVVGGELVALAVRRARGD